LSCGFLRRNHLSTKMLKTTPITTVIRPAIVVWLQDNGCQAKGPSVSGYYVDQLTS
jgi:hypothetical protein